nr:MAG TPA: hypothetical protein [Caudoviricetes sp.]
MIFNKSLFISIQLLQNLFLHHKIFYILYKFHYSPHFVWIISGYFY